MYLSISPCTSNCSPFKTMPYVIKESVVKSVLRMTKVGSNQLQRNHRPKGDEKFTKRLGQEAKYNFPCGAHSRHSSPFSLAAQNLVPDLPRPSGLHSKYARGYYFICKKDLGYEISTYLYSLPSPPPPGYLTSCMECMETL